MQSRKYGEDMETSYGGINTDQLLIDTSELFKHVYMFEQKFDIKPRRFHYGIAIAHTDLQERRERFVEELVSTAIDWIFSQAQQQGKIDGYTKQGRTQSNAHSMLRQEALRFFRSPDNPDQMKGQFGELLLANCLQNIFKAVPLLRKMPLTTNPKQERLGADAIHYRHDGLNNFIYLGEAKCYSSKYKFNQAFSDGVNSIMTTYENLSSEIGCYIAGDFLDQQMRHIADSYRNGTLLNTKVELVLIVIYEENQPKSASSEDEIRSEIKGIIERRFGDYNDAELANYDPMVLSRITYIAFPVWGLHSLLQSFVGAL